MVLTYQITELVPPADALTPDGITSAMAVNSAGAAAGTAWQEKNAEGEAVLWTEPDVPQVLEPVPPGGFGLGINGRGDVVGVLDLPNLRLHKFGKVSAFVFHADDGNLENLAPIVGGDASFAVDISDEGVVVGYAGDDFYLGHSPVNGHAFSYDSKNGALTPIDPLPGHAFAFANAVNESGHVVGRSAVDAFTSVGVHLFIHRDGVTEDLGLAYNVEDVNDADVITGERAFSAQVPYPCAYRCDAAAARPTFENLGATLPPPFIGSHGAGINNDGAIVGWAYDAGGDPHAMIHNPDGPDAGWTDLNDALVDKDGWNLQYAWGISDSGHIVGTGLHHGLTRAFVLEPHTPHHGAEDKIAEIILVLILILGGGTVDGPGGIGITGGGNPVPVGPQEFAPLWRRLSPSERDTYVGHAIHALGRIISSRDVQAEVERVARQIVESSRRDTSRG